MLAMWMVQVPVNQIVHVITMRDRRMPARRAVDMPGLVTAAAVRRRAVGWIAGADLESVLLDRLGSLMVQVPVVQVVGVPVVHHRGVTAAGAMLMGVIGMGARHDELREERKGRRGTAEASAALGGVTQDVVDQLEDVGVRQGVEHMLALTPRAQQPFAAQQLQALRDGRHGITGVGGDLRDTPLTGGQQIQQPEASRVTGGAEHPGGTGNDGRFRLHAGGGERMGPIPGGAGR
jgi:hypothetical protein